MPETRWRLLSLFLLALLPLTARAEPKKYNVLFLFSDDQRADTIAALGNPHIRTPNLDRLVKAGTTFRRGYCMGAMQGAVCVPSRAMLLTGRTLFRIHEKMEGQTTWPEMFARAGYRTFITGKWHNGPASLLRAFMQGKSIFLGGMGDPYDLPIADITPEHKLTAPRKAPKHSVEQFADCAIEFIRGQKGDAPWVTYVPFNAPHDPRLAPKTYHDETNATKPPLPPNFRPQHPFNNGAMTGRDEELAPWPRTPELVRQHLADYYAAITFLDAQVGRILDALRESGQAANTIIVFTSDHGLAIGSHGLFGKQNLYDCSMHVPLIISGPGIPAGQQSDALVYLLDLFPTLGDLCGVSAPAGSEGKSLAPVLQGKADGVRETLFTAYTKAQRAIRDDRFHLIRYPQVNRTQLFDLHSDPHETKDLADDPSHAADVQRLTARLKEWQQKLGDTLPLTSAQPQPLEFDFSKVKRVTPKKDMTPERHLPGATAEGYIRMPNSWSIKPAGRHVELGDFPVNLALHPSGKWVAALHAGFGRHEVIIVDVAGKKEQVVSRATLEQTFVGLAFSPDGQKLYASGGEFDRVHAFDFEDGYLARPRTLPVSDAKFIPGGLAVSPDGGTLYVAGVWGHAVCILPIADPKDRVHIPFGKDSYPYTCTVDSKGKRLYVSLWARAQVAVIDLATNTVVQTLDTEPHPTEMVFGPGEKTLFVACANSTRVSVIDLATGRGLETINCALYPSAPSGNTPNSLALTPDGQLLFVANADANNVGVFNVSEPGKTRPLGFIPTGKYPTAVRYNPANKRLLIANGRGLLPKANPHGPNPTAPKTQTIREYIADLYRGTLGIVDLPTEQQMVAYSKQAYQCSPLRDDLAPVLTPPKHNPIPARVGTPSPIKYVIYIIRENRTYDQVFGDIKEGNGAPHLCIFPEKVTPNAHRLARQFVLLDNLYCDGEVSAEGHEWTMGAYCTDFVKKVWPLSYRGSPTKKLEIYPAEGNFDPVARPAGGYLWDRAAEAKVTYRSYGEWISNGKTPADPGKPRVKALEGHYDPGYRGYDLDYPDVKRAARFLEELKRFERDGGMPQLSIVRLPNDHTYGTLKGKPTPTAMVAENDLALGRLIEGITKSKFWKETAVFVIEDDAQNGADHVDAHRTVALCISPYTQHGQVDSTMYSTASMLRTMELILGLRPMSQFDAAARPMYASFRATPNLKEYTHVVPDVDLTAINTATAWGAKLSDTFDFSKEDAADDLLFNEVIWRSVRGPNSSAPPPVRAAFVFPHLPRYGGKDDDDE